MKKWLIAIIVLNVISGVITAASLFAQNWFLGLIGLATTILAIVPTIAIIRLLGEVEDLRASVQYLQERQRYTEQVMSESPELLSIMQTQPVGHTWACPRCRTVNKSGTAVCESCGAAFYKHS